MNSKQSYVRLCMAAVATTTLSTAVALASTAPPTANHGTVSNIPVASHRTVTHHTSVSPSRKARYSADSDSAQYITIQSGQSFWSIAHEYGVSITDLENWNGLSSRSILHVGQRMIVGWGGSSQSSTLSSRDGSVDASMAGSVQSYQIAQYAQNFLGVPYVYGGTTPAGFDCSGFVKYVYAHFGIGLARDSYDQYQMGTSVSESELRPGDLVFFASDGAGASHVGIYVGNGEFINAAGSSVRFSSLNESYWANCYVGARRIV